MSYKIAVIVDGSDGALHESGKAVCAALESAGHQVSEIEVGPQLVAALKADKPQAAFVASRMGRPGSLQDMLELLEIPYVGSAALAVRNAGCSRAFANAIASYYGGFDGCASLPASICLGKDAFQLMGASDALDAVVDKIPGGYPVAVAPAAGQAAGPIKACSASELSSAVETLLSECQEVAICEWVEGVMLSVAVLGPADDPFALPPVEIGVNAEGEGEVHAPVRLESLSADESVAQAVRSEVERAAVEVYMALGCRDFGCVQIVWDGARARVLGVETAPSMDDRSLFLLSCKVADLGREAILEELLEQAVYRV